MIAPVEGDSSGISAQMPWRVQNAGAGSCQGLGYDLVINFGHAADGEFIPRSLARPYYQFSVRVP
jgi:hypothetical protein